MQLLVFEIARHFVVENTRWLVEHADWETTQEGVFRVRALMLMSMLAGEGVPLPTDELVFNGFDDSLFDEAVYSASHLLCAQGVGARSQRRMVLCRKRVAWLSWTGAACN